MIKLYHYSSFTDVLKVVYCEKRPSVRKCIDAPKPTVSLGDTDQIRCAFNF